MALGTSLYTGLCYQVRRNGPGVIIQKQDGSADCYLQGDDATTFLDDLDNSLMAWEPSAILPHRYSVIDMACGEYAHIME